MSLSPWAAELWGWCQIVGGRYGWGGGWEWLYLRVIAADTRASSPGTVADVGLAVSKAADEFF